MAVTMTMTFMMVMVMVMKKELVSGLMVVMMVVTAADAANTLAYLLRS